MARTALKLGSGTHMSFGGSSITVIQEPGIFIPYDPNGGQAMDELNRFLVRYGYCPPGEGIPDEILGLRPEDSAIAHTLRTWMKQDNNNLDDQELEEKFRERIRHLGPILRRIRLEKETGRLPDRSSCE